ncbi:helicase-exonuclease AddAB subunit AddA, partial [Streptococcus agalactiae]|nr:helicase-exonuclease AddAB subunit AddA [Streptococcus agalactiae]MCK6378226.1 helicase-exonuclease AddAB subunit AddA [Streptococcus agalactiae]
YKAYQDNPSQGKLIILKENFRSQSEVLDSTNSVFTHLMDEEVGDILYDESHQLKAGSPRQQERHPNNKTQVLLLDTDEDDIDDSDSQQYDISPAEAKLVAKEIIRLHKEENVPFQDITLLVSSRTRNDGILQTFDRYGIPLVTDGGEQNYLKSVEVMVMLDTLRSIDNPLNDYALVALLRSPMFGFNEDDLTRIAIQDVKMAFYHKVKLSYHKEGHHSDLITPELSSKIDHFMKT